MADTKLSALTDAGALQDGDQFYVVRSNTSLSTTLESMKQAIGNIEGTVVAYANLPITLGTPAIGMIYIVQTSTGIWPINYHGAGMYIRIGNAGALADWQWIGNFTEVLSDAFFTLFDQTDDTKQAMFNLASISTATTRTYVLPDANGTMALISNIPVAANPTASIGLTAVNGTAGTWMRSDGAPALSQSISPTWSGNHSFSAAITSTVSTGTAPFVVASTTNVANLNASSLSGATFAAPGPIGSTTKSTGAFTTISVTGQITSTLAIGTAPFAVTSTTNVANLNASSLSGATFAAPGPIGSGTASTGAFTTLSSSGLYSAAGGISITGGSNAAGTISKSASGGLMNQGVTGTVYDWSVLDAAGTSFVIGITAGTNNVVIASGGNLSVSGALSVTATSTLTGNVTIGTIGTTGVDNVLLLQGSSMSGFGPYVELTINGSAVGFFGCQNAILGGGSNNFLVLAAGALTLGSNGAVSLTLDVSSNATFVGSITTAAPISGTAAAWKHGIFVSGAPSATGYVQLDVGGTLRKLLCG